METEKGDKKSLIWKFFTAEESSIKCNEKGCNFEYSLNSSVTTLKYHLKKHIESYEQYKKLKPQQLQQSSILQFVEKLPVARVNKINEKIAYFIAHDMRPYETVEGDGFKQMISALEPKYQVPSSYYFRKTGIPNLYNKLKAELLLILKNDLKCLSFTTDYWQSSFQDSYLTVTLHFIDSEFMLKSYVLDTLKHNSSHTALAVSEKIIEIFRNFGLNLQNFGYSFSTTDQGANIKAALRDHLKIPNIPCCNHALNNLITSIYKESNEGIFQNIKEACQKIAIYLRSSYIIKQDLQDICDQYKWQYTSPKLYSPTRFNGIYLMLVSIQKNLKQIDILSTQNAHTELRKLRLRSDQIKQLEDIVQFLQPFNEITIKMSGEKYVTSSQILVYCQLIEKQLLQENKGDSDWIQDLKIKSKKSYTKYFENYYINNIEICQILLKCTFLDPRYKELNFLQNEIKLKIIENINEEVNRINPIIEQQINQSNNQQMESEDSDNNNNMCSINKMISKLLNKQETDKVTKREIDIYNELTEYISQNTNPLQWWQTRKQQFPNLYQLSKIYLSIQGTFGHP
ncbi:hypothetical protein ABPG72_013608 [Tetrahymena utriculariae]